MHARKSEVAFDDSKRTLEIGPHTGLEFFNLLKEGNSFAVFVKRDAFQASSRYDS